MTLNIIKLAVGCKSVEDLKAWQESRPDPLAHVTRMWPKRADEIKGKGSIYWVINGEIRARQKILGFEERIGTDGIRRCAICLDRNLKLTEIAPRRAFQGWRYFPSADAPNDLPEGREAENLPDEIARALGEIGLR